MLSLSLGSEFLVLSVDQHSNLIARQTPPGLSLGAESLARASRAAVLVAPVLSLITISVIVDCLTPRVGETPCARSQALSTCLGWRPSAQHQVQPWSVSPEQLPLPPAATRDSQAGLSPHGDKHLTALLLCDPWFSEASGASEAFV